MTLAPTRNASHSSPQSLELVDISNLKSLSVYTHYFFVVINSVIFPINSSKSTSLSLKNS